MILHQNLSQWDSPILNSEIIELAKADILPPVSQMTELRLTEIKRTALILFSKIADCPKLILTDNQTNSNLTLSRR